MVLTVFIPKIFFQEGPSTEYSVPNDQKRLKKSEFLKQKKEIENEKNVYWKYSIQSY